jgi:hypothetical protein
MPRNWNFAHESCAIVGNEDRESISFLGGELTRGTESSGPGKALHLHGNSQVSR